MGFVDPRRLASDRSRSDRFSTEGIRTDPKILTMETAVQQWHFPSRFTARVEGIVDLNNNLKFLANILVAYFLVASAELVLHWYIGSRSDDLAEMVCEVYRYHDGQLGKSNLAWIPDYFLPSVLLGAA